MVWRENYDNENNPFKLLEWNSEATWLVTSCVKMDEHINGLTRELLISLWRVLRFGPFHHHQFEQMEVQECKAQSRHGRSMSVSLEEQ